jgi:hypothetical protein
MRSHAASIGIAAPADVVWKALTDLPSYPQWNGTITRAAGRVEPGERLQLWLELGTEARAFDPRVVDVEPGRLLLLEKVAATPRLLRATHAFRLQPLVAGRTRLTQAWELSGALAAVVCPDSGRGCPRSSG